jgi:hypothetical protein
LNPLAASRPYNTVTDAALLAALEKSNGHRKRAADLLGISERRVLQRIADMKASGAYSGGVQEAIPEGHVVKGVSTLYNAEGAVAGQWVKTSLDLERQKELTLNALKDSLKSLPTVPRIPAPSKATKALLTAYPMGDPHIGLYAWAEECGEDFDLAIAERDLVRAMQTLVDKAPTSEQALIVNLGDFFHSDSQANTTARSNNQLDVDTRWAKVLRVGISAMRACIEAALEKHKSVRVINEIGNHDTHTAQLLTLALACLYEKNPRVTLDQSPSRFHYVRFHNVLLGVTHGDMVKPDKLGGIMATDRHEDWGQTKYRYWLTGHVHSQRVFELPGCLVESFRTLAAKDAWHSASGYRSGRDMQAIVFDRDFGEVSRYRADIAMVRRMA